jgi:hypothetical protein
MIGRDSVLEVSIGDVMSTHWYSLRLKMNVLLLIVGLAVVSIGFSVSFATRVLAQPNPALSAEQNLALAEAARLDQEALQFFQRGERDEAVSLLTRQSNRMHSTIRHKR